MNTQVPGAGSTPTPDDYLAITSLTDGIFLIGVLDSGVTIFNQQVRALNLVWALHRAKRLDSASKIAIVGGGIAGLTAAMALRTIFSFKAGSPHPALTLFEQRSVLCPLQRGCATRWVHPHIYDWPKAGSTNPSAGLPIMNWRAGRASDVATTIVTEWEEPSYIEVKAVAVEEWRNLRYLKIDHNSREIEWVGERCSDGAASLQVLGDTRQFDLIILAIGFGGELGTTKNRAFSYWRNETYSQPYLLGRQQRFLVSGTGDGGLVDLLRLRVADFREDRIGHQLAPEGSDRYKAIQTLRETCYKDPSTQGAELFEQARQLGRKLDLINDIKGRLRADTTASIQIRTGNRVSDAFRGKSSFVNRFLVSLLFEAGGFSPRFGDLEIDDDRAEGFDEVIIRHGTNPVAHMKSFFSGDISVLLDDLKKKRDNQKWTIDISQSVELWEPGWPFDRGSGPGREKRDYVPDATVAVSSAFVSALAPIFSARGGNYRATLHRVVSSNQANEVHLQQIAHYHGGRATKSAHNVVGRLFKISDAVIGLAARTGRVLTTLPKDRPPEECRRLLVEDMRRLHGETWDPRRMDDEVSALFACPLIYSTDNAPDGAKTSKVIAVLFADSTELTAFGEETVTQIVAACEEFGRYLQRIGQRQGHSQATEFISVKSQATWYPAHDSSTNFDEFSVLTASRTPAPNVAVEYINLDWWT